MNADVCQRREEPTHPLRLWRYRHEVSQEELAGLAHLTQSYISLIERYVNTPQDDALERLRWITGIPADGFVRARAFLQESPDFLGKGH